MKAKKKKKVAAGKPAEKKARGIRGLNGKTVCENWIQAFESKAVKTAAQCTEFMNKQFPGRASAIFNFPNVVKMRANKTLLDGQVHKYAKYPVDGEAKKKVAS